MSLDPAGLKTDIEALASSPPATIALCATAWADAMGAYAADVVPASTTVASATATLDAALALAFDNTDEATTAAAMETAFATFATSVGAGMAPAFVATPPPGLVGFAALMVPPFPSTHSEAAEDVRDIIDAWMKTGLAQAAGGPPPPPVNWS